MIFESMADYLRDKQYNKSYGDDTESPIKDKPNPFKIDIPGIIDSKITNVLMKVLPSSVGMLAASLAPVLSGTLLTTIYKIYKKDKSLDILKSLKKNYETFSQGKHPVEELLKKYHSPLFTLLKVLYSGGQTWLSILNKFKTTALKALIGTLDAAEELVGHVRYRILPHFVEDEEGFFKGLASGILGPLALFLEPLKSTVGLVLKIIGKPTLFLFSKLLKNPWNWIKSKLPFGRSKSWIDVILNQVTKGGLKGLFTPKFIKNLMGSLGLGVFWYPLKPYLNLVLKRATYYYEIAKDFLIKLYEKITQLIDVLLGKANIGKTGFTEGTTQTESKPKPSTSESISSTSKSKTEEPSWAKTLTSKITSVFKKFSKYIPNLSKIGEFFTKIKGTFAKVRNIFQNRAGLITKAKGVLLILGVALIGLLVAAFIHYVWPLIKDTYNLLKKIISKLLPDTGDLKPPPSGPLLSKKFDASSPTVQEAMLKDQLHRYKIPIPKDLNSLSQQRRIQTLEELLYKFYQSKGGPNPLGGPLLPEKFYTSSPTVQEAILKGLLRQDKVPLPKNLDSLSQQKRIQTLEELLYNAQVQHFETVTGKDANQKPTSPTKVEGNPKPTTPDSKDTSTSAINSDLNSILKSFDQWSKDAQIHFLKKEAQYYNVPLPKNLDSLSQKERNQLLRKIIIEGEPEPTTKAESKPKDTGNLKTALNTVGDFFSPQANAAEINLSAIPKNIKPTLSFNSVVILTDLKNQQQPKPIYVPLSVPVSSGGGAFISEPVLV